MGDKASKDLDSQLSFFTQCMLVFYRKACALQFVYSLPQPLKTVVLSPFLSIC